MESMTDAVFTVREAAVFLKVHLRQIRIFLRTGVLESVKPSARTTRIPRRALAAFLAVGEPVKQERE
jgi:excisionase family DNA binding protein